ncbi:hypothetical protein OHB00_37495 [Streptomyces sp. NBC_00631]|uniref:hypothetical protein n=1 Tax=Streptomyces sp. NBC_00631 TaxID=2975793 RepID=UPI0030DE5DD4
MTGSARLSSIHSLVVGGGRAADALRSITVSQHLFGIERVVVVHHSFCGATSFSAEGITAAWEHEQHSDISSLYDWDGIAIADFETSLHYDVALIRNSPGTPKQVAVPPLLRRVARRPERVPCPPGHRRTG